MQQGRNSQNKTSTLDEEIEYKLKRNREKLEIKRKHEFYTLEYHPKKIVKK